LLSPPPSLLRPQSVLQPFPVTRPKKQMPSHYRAESAQSVPRELLRRPVAPGSAHHVPARIESVIIPPLQEAPERSSTDLEHQKQRQEQHSAGARFQSGIYRENLLAGNTLRHQPGSAVSESGRKGEVPKFSPKAPRPSTILKNRRLLSIFAT
jgi:hypothetical protein